MLPAPSVTFLASVPWIGPRALLRLHRRGLGFARMDWPELAAAVERERPDVLGVDVFDTCLMRDLATDWPIEAAIAHRNSRRADDATDDAEVLEREMCRPVPEAATALGRIRAAGTRIVFVSDTDRPSHLLAQILRTHGLIGPGERVVASCEEGATKSDGDLFELVFGPMIEGEGEGEESRTVVWHAGNNPWADGVMAARSGVRPIEMPAAELNRYESAIAADRSGLGAAIAAAARRARLDVEADQRAGVLPRRRAVVQELGADIAGQSMIAFVLWVAEECRREEVDHVAFLARDGELPMLLARSMPGDYWVGRPMSYLHCSRMVWSLASASSIGLGGWLAAGTADDQAFLEVNRHDVPLQQLMGRIGLEVNDLDGLPVPDQLRAIPLGQPLPVDAVQAWHELLFHPDVGAVILERSRARRDILADYLRAEGVDQGRLALVDVGWRGRLAWHISSVLRDVVDHDPLHLHFGGDKVIPEVDRAIDIRRFAFDGIDGQIGLSRPVSAVETLTASGRPRVVDYQRDETGSVKLEFGLGAGDLKSDRSDLWEGALRVAAALPSSKQLDDWGIDNRSIGPEVVDLLAEWWDRPTGDEATALAGLEFEHDEAGTAMRPLATAYSLSEAMAPNVRQWPQGSEAMTPAPFRVTVRIARWLKDRFSGADIRRPEPTRWRRS